MIPLPQGDDQRVIAQVLWVDRFGNAQLNVGTDDLPSGCDERAEVRFGSATDPAVGTVRSALRVDSFSMLAGGAIGLLVDSSGMLALAMDQRSAADELDLAAGDQVTLLPARDDGSPAPQPVRLGRR